VRGSLRADAAARYLGLRLGWAALAMVVLWWPAPPSATVAAGAREAASRPLAQLDDGGRVAPAANPASLHLREERLRGRSVWVHGGVAPEQVDWAVRGWEAAAELLPAATGLAVPGEPLALYLFDDGDAFRTLTSELTGLPQSAIHAFEGGRSYATGTRRGIYINAGTLRSADQSARLVAHELVHLAERDALGHRAIPRWFSEGLAEYVSQQVMASINARAAAERHWRRAAALASALHHNTAYPLSAITSPVQWNDAAAAGYDRLIYSEALLATQWLLKQGRSGTSGRLLGEVARDRGFPAALELATGIPAASLDARVDAALRADLLPRYPIGVHLYEDVQPLGTRFQFAAVGLPPGEVLTRQFTRDDGYEARDSGAPALVGPAGAAYWTFQTRPDSVPATWWVTVQGNQGTWSRVPFRVLPVADASASP
jgi:hypothetical protein